MTPEQLAQAVLDALAALVAGGDLDLGAPLPETVVLERPRQAGQGDYATTVALQLAKKAGRPPREVAALLATKLEKLAGVAAVEVAGPGFVNITLAAGAQGELARTIVHADGDYGRGTVFAGERTNLEFVSANPTGPIHIGGVRWAAVGDSLGRVLAFAGAEVTREYYFNDHGVQIDRFARSLQASALGQPSPADGYGGEYIEELASQIVRDRPGVLQRSDAEQLEIFRDDGTALEFTAIKASLHDFGVDFDVYFHEDSLHASGAVDRALTRLRGLGSLYEADGATWLRTSSFGDDKDRVVVKSDGEPAYISADLAYYLDKRERGFDRAIIMLGADHHGYVGRLMAMCAAFGDVPGKNLEILIGQLVNLLRDGEPLRMSKRAGTVISLEDLVDAIGVDAARYALARYSVDTTIDLDLDLWSKQSQDNPVYYVQYAHARTCSVTRNAATVGITLQDQDFEPSLLAHEREGTLLSRLAEFPGVVAAAAQLREVHRIARYAEALAGDFHRWYDVCRVIPRGDEPVEGVNRSRLWLNEATRTVLANALSLLGVTAPERM